ncbi:hypothetical protein G7046_g3994 [Stylonectria norvegica]|nr:hypothetical protein G7046_g3994 [Stylonectria norvegica]
MAYLDSSLPVYSATDDGHLFMRIEQASDLTLPIMRSPNRLDRCQIPDWAHDEFAVATEPYKLQDDIVSSFFASIEQGRDDVVADFIARGFVSPHTTNAYMETPLLAAVRVHSTPMVSKLVSLGAAVDGYGRARSETILYNTNLPQRTPLQYAAELGNLALVRVLREDYGADDGLIAPDGAIAIRLAAMNGHREIVDYLPARRGGAWLRWKTAHEKEMERVRKAFRKIGDFLKFFVWHIPKYLLYDLPKDVAQGAWKRRYKFGRWCKRQLTEIPSRLKRGGKRIWRGVKATPRAIKEMVEAIWSTIKAIPGALKAVACWIGRGLEIVGEAVFGVVKKLASLVHTLVSAIVTFFREITLKDVQDGITYFLRAIFIETPKGIWSFIVTFGDMSYHLLQSLLGGLGEALWCLAWVVLWLVTYIPQKLWRATAAIGRSIKRGYQEQDHLNFHPARQHTTLINKAGYRYEHFIANQKTERRTRYLRAASRLWPNRRTRRPLTVSSLRKKPSPWLQDESQLSRDGVSSHNSPRRRGRIDLHRRIPGSMGEQINGAATLVEAGITGGDQGLFAAALRWLQRPEVELERGREQKQAAPPFVVEMKAFSMARPLILSLLLISIFSSLGFASPCSPVNPGTPGYCKNPQWKNDLLVRLMEESNVKPYAQYVCTTALQPVVIRSGTTSTHFTGDGTSTSTSTIVEISTKTNHATTTQTVTRPEATVTRSVPIATVTSYEASKTITVVVNHGVTSTLSGSTVTETVATVTETESTSTKTDTTTSVDYAGATTTKTITSGVETRTQMIYTSTETLFSPTDTDYVYRTSTSLDVRTTGTKINRFTTGTTTRYLARETDVVRKTATVFVHRVASTRTNIRHTSTYDINPIYSIQTLTEYTATETVDIPTTTKIAYQTIGTVLQTVATGTDFVRTTSTFTGGDEVTKFTTVATGTTTEYETTVSVTYLTGDDEEEEKRKRSEPTAAIEARAPRAAFKDWKDGWIESYGEGHFKSACSCVVTFPLPTRTKYQPPNTVTTKPRSFTATATRAATATSTDVHTTVSTCTRTDHVPGPTTTVQVPYISTKHVCQTFYTTVTVDATTYSFTTQTFTDRVTKTEKSTPIDEITDTVTSTNTDQKEATTTVPSVVYQTESGVKTEYDTLDITRTSDALVIRTSDVDLVISTGVEATATSLFDTTVTTTDSTEYSSILSTADETIGDVLTRTIPIVSTDIEKLIHTVTIFTDATTTYQVEATSTVGVITTSTVLTIVTVSQNTTRTYTSTVEVESTVSATATATQYCHLPIVDGDFETEDPPWYLSSDDQVGGYIDTPGFQSEHRFQSNNMFDNDLLEFYQDMQTCGGVDFVCSYRWLYTSTYETEYTDGYTYVPYVRVYINDDLFSNRRGDYNPVNEWNYAQFYYTSSDDGKDRWWFDAASPQARNGTDGGSNYLSIDQVRCSVRQQRK